MPPIKPIAEKLAQRTKTVLKGKGVSLVVPVDEDEDIVPVPADDDNTILEYEKVRVGEPLVSRTETPTAVEKELFDLEEFLGLTEPGFLATLRSIWGNPPQEGEPPDFLGRLIWHLDEVFKGLLAIPVGIGNTGQIALEKAMRVANDLDKRMGFPGMTVQAPGELPRPLTDEELEEAIEQVSDTLSKGLEIGASFMVPPGALFGPLKAGRGIATLKTATGGANPLAQSASLPQIAENAARITAESVAASGKAATGGASVGMTGAKAGMALTEGIAVGIPPSKVIPGVAKAEDMVDFVAANPELFSAGRGLGVFTTEGRTTYNAIEVVPDLKAAIKLSPGEDSYFNLATKELIPNPLTNGTTGNAIFKSAEDAAERLQDFVDITPTGVVLREALIVEGKLSQKAFNDVAGLAAAQIWEGRNTIETFSAGMIETMGETIRPFLPRLFEESQKTLSKIITKLDSPAAKDLVKRLVKSEDTGEFVGYAWWKGVKPELDTMLGEADGKIVRRLIAALSPQRGPEVNTKLAFEVYRRWKLGLPIEDAIVPGSNGRILKAEVAGNVKRVFNDEPLSGLKVKNMDEAMDDDTAAALNAVVNDTWIAKIFGTTGDVLGNDPQVYQFISEVIRTAAKGAGMTPRDFQAALWVATRLEKGIPVEKSADLIKIIQQERVALEPFQKLLKLNEEGAARIATLIALSKMVGGAAVGGTVGDNLEDRLRNAFIGAGVAALANPRNVRIAATALREQTGAFIPQTGRFSGLARIGAKLIEDEKILDVETFTRRMAQRLELGPTRAGESVRERLPEAFENAKRLIANKQLRRDELLAKAIPEVTDAEVAAFADEGVGVVTIAGRTIKVDWNLMDDPAAVKQAIDKIVSIRGAKIEEARRGVLHAEEIQKLADDLNMNAEDLLKKPIGQAFNVEQIEATKSLLNAHLDTLNRLNEAYRNLPRGTKKEAALVALKDHFAISSKMTDAFLGVRAEAGRALPAFGGSVTARAEGVASVAQMSEKGLLLKAERFSDLLANTADENKLGFATRLASKGGLKRDNLFMLRIWYDFLLSAPQTQVVNMLGSIIATGVSPVERQIAAGVGLVKGLKPEDRILMMEPTWQVLGMVGATFDAFWGALRTAQTGTSQFRRVRELPTAIRELEKGGYLKQLTNVLAVFEPIRGMMSGDEFMKIINARGIAYSKAMREASLQRLQGQARIDFANRFMKDIPDEVWEISKRIAAYNTFTDDLPVSLEKLQQVIEANPVLKVWIPFFKTPSDLGLWNLNKIPFLGNMVATAKQVGKGLESPSVERTLAQARQLMGTAVLAIVAQQVMAGRVVGRGPLNPNVNRDWREWNIPYSWQPFGTDTQISFNRFDQFGSLVGLVADVIQISSYLNVDELSELYVALSMAFTNAVASKTYMEGFGKFLRTVMVRRPGDAPAVEQVFNTFTRSLVPAGLARLNETTGVPFIPADKRVRALYTTIDRMCDRIPGCSDKLFPEVNLLGEDRVVNNGLPPWASLFSPVVVNRKPETEEEIRSKAIFDYLVENEITAPPIARGIGRAANPREIGAEKAGDPVALDPEQHYTLKKMAGNGLKFIPAELVELFGVTSKKRMLGLRDALDLLINDSPTFRRITPAAQARTIKGLIAASRSNSRNALLALKNPDGTLKFPELSTKVLDRQLGILEEISPRAKEMIEDQVRVLFDQAVRSAQPRVRISP